MPYLARKLNRLLTDHIRRTIPKLKDQIAVQITDAEDELYDLGRSPTESPQAKSYFVSQVLGNIGRSFTESLEGGHLSPSANPGELIGGARLRYIFRFGLVWFG